MEHQKTMRAMIIETMYGGRKATKITDVPYPICHDNQIILKVKTCSICKHCEAFYDGGGSASMVKPKDYPITLGHEFSGEIVEVGKDVHHLKIGDRVTVDNTVLCGECYHCKRNEPLYCDNFGSMGHNLHGGFAEYVVALGEKAFLIPDNISYNEAACTEPVACCMHAMDRMQMRYGDNVAILGAGSMALILAQLVKNSSAGHTVVIGSTQSKLDICQKEFGIDTLLMNREDYSIHENIIKNQFPHGLDIVIDTTGSAKMANSALRMLGKGGKLIMYTQVDDMSIEDPANFTNYEQSIIMAYCQTHNYGRSLDALRSGRVNLKPLITHEFSLEDYMKALDTNLTDRNSLKVVIHPEWEKGKTKCNL
ncbi:MAG: alcohol dehydrogenase catalytic domain-containing protein [Clostridiales bacterium]|nr:alcohol dehydrogenase catalytic domain-containing protein [Clostridiales bacterium]